MSSLAIITARGGSKRIPKKNIRLFHGRPIIAYSIEAAIKSNLFDEVMVSTDDIEIASIGKSLGASVPFLRSDKTAGDFSTTSDVLKEVLGQYKNMGRNFQNACCIYPTAPFITVQKLIDASVLLTDDSVDSVVSVARFDFPIWRSFKMNEKTKTIIYNWPEFATKRSQDLPPSFHDCGQFYFFRVEKFLKSNSLIMETTKAIEMPQTEVQDIDNEEDWKIAELKYSIFINKNQ